MYYHCAGVKWGGDPPKKSELVETVHQKLVGGCAQKRPPGVALLDLKVWRGQMDDKRGSGAKDTCATSERLRLDGVSVHGPNTRTVGFRMF